MHEKEYNGSNQENVWISGNACFQLISSMSWVGSMFSPFTSLSHHTSDENIFFLEVGLLHINSSCVLTQHVRINIIAPEKLFGAKFVFRPLPLWNSVQTLNGLPNQNTQKQRCYDIIRRNETYYDKC